MSPRPILRPIPTDAPSSTAGDDQRCGVESPELKSALQVLGRETTALGLLAENLSQDGASSLVRAVDSLADCGGRVVVSGMGKSGLIGRKIAATLASTGTLAHFVHPAEASHGDLGMIAPGDAIIGLSNSGETQELADLLAYTDQMAIPVVAITSRANSSLARRADVLLLLPEAPEACPLGLAPTTSTTMMLALGDALAVAVMERKCFTMSDFRLRHPGGKLGRRLARVEDLIGGTEELPLVHLDAAMTEVILVMGRTGYGSAGVIDDHGQLIGMITEPDLRRHMGPDLLTYRAGEVMTTETQDLRPEMPAAEALHMMTQQGMRNLFVTEGGRPIGILHVDDCRRASAG